MRSRPFEFKLEHVLHVYNELLPEKAQFCVTRILWMMYELPTHSLMFTEIWEI